MPRNCKSHFREYCLYGKKLVSSCLIMLLAAPVLSGARPTLQISHTGSRPTTHFILSRLHNFSIGYMQAVWMYLIGVPVSL